MVRLGLLKFFGFGRYLSSLGLGVEACLFSSGAGAAEVLLVLSVCTWVEPGLVGQ